MNKKASAITAALTLSSLLAIPAYAETASGASAGTGASAYGTTGTGASVYGTTGTGTSTYGTTGGTTGSISGTTGATGYTTGRYDGYGTIGTTGTRPGISPYGDGYGTAGTDGYTGTRSADQSGMTGTGASYGTNEYRTTAADNNVDWGWLGLIGLAGLVGLMGRGRETDRMK